MGASQSQDSSGSSQKYSRISKDYFYHYTTLEGADGIFEERKIKMTDKGKDGKGVYLTRLEPENSKHAIMVNNFDNIKNQEKLKLPKYDGKDRYFFRFPQRHLVGTEKKNNVRDVWRYPKCISLDDEHIYWEYGETEVEIFTDTLNGLLPTYFHTIVRQRKTDVKKKPR